MRSFDSTPSRADATPPLSHAPRGRLDRSVAATVRRDQGRGEPLPAGAQKIYGAALGHDFSAVRIHADAASTASAGALRARAFTSGTDIWFGAGRFAPHTPAGGKLLVHELAHVVEQSALTPDGRHPERRGEACVPTLQLAPDEPGTASPVLPDQPAMVDPLLDDETMAKVAQEGARQLDEYMAAYRLGCGSLRREISLSEAFVASDTPEFSSGYEQAIASIREQALRVLREARSYFMALDTPQRNRWGAAALEMTDIAIAAIEDGQDIVFVVDSRTAEGRAVLSRIDHFREQLAIRDEGFRDEDGSTRRLSAGVSTHEGKIDMDEGVAGDRPPHRSVSVVDIGALYDNRALEAFTGPIQDPPGTLHVAIDTAAAVDIRALFIHEVGGHAATFQTPAQRERLARGQKPTEQQVESHTGLEESLVDNMVDKTAFYSAIRDDLSRQLLVRLGSR